MKTMIARSTENLDAKESTDMQGRSEWGKLTTNLSKFLLIWTRQLANVLLRNEPVSSALRTWLPIRTSMYRELLSNRNIKSEISTSIVRRQASNFSTKSAFFIWTNNWPNNEQNSWKYLVNIEWNYLFCYCDMCRVAVIDRIPKINTHNGSSWMPYSSKFVSSDSSDGNSSPIIFRTSSLIFRLFL